MNSSALAAAESTASLGHRLPGVHCTPGYPGRVQGLYSGYSPYRYSPYRVQGIVGMAWGGVLIVPRSSYCGCVIVPPWPMGPMGHGAHGGCRAV